MRRELLVVFRHALVHIHQFRSDIAIRAIDMIRRQLIRDLCRSAVARDGRLLQLRDKPDRRDQFHAHLCGCGIQHVEGFDVRLPAPLLEELEHVLRVRLVMRRAHMIRC